jgi:hypothetical protein
MTSPFRSRGSIETGMDIMRKADSFQVGGGGGGGGDAGHHGKGVSSSAAAFALAAGRRAVRYEQLMVVCCNDSIIVIGRFSKHHDKDKHHSSSSSSSSSSSQTSADLSATSSSSQKRLSFCTMNSSDVMLLPMTGLKMVSNIPGQPLLVWVASKCALVYKHGHLGSGRGGGGGGGAPKFGKARSPPTEKQPRLRKKQSAKDLRGAGGEWTPLPPDEGDEYEAQDMELCFSSAYAKKTFVDCVEKGQRHAKDICMLSRQQSKILKAVGSPHRQSLIAGS